MTKKIPKALVLMSGGLDSMLAAKFLMEHGIETKGITFQSFFFGPAPAQKAADYINLPLEIIDFSQEHLEVVKKPRYGRGSAMNPCIDCHLLMIKKAKDIMEKQGYDFVATGEVLGERPMSQNKKSLDLIAEKSGLKDRLFRPLSAKLLAETIVQKNNWIKEAELLNISGRSRKKQLELAGKYNIKEFQNPGGGCLLTEKLYGEKLKQLLGIANNPSKSDFDLLRFGRHFAKNKVKYIISRNQNDDENMRKLAVAGDILIEMKDIPGPLALVRGYGSAPDTNNFDEVKNFIRYYSAKAKNLKNIEYIIFPVK